MTIQSILDKLPYSDPFRFVDGLDAIDSNKVTGHFTFREDLDFYKGHFKGYPITPGVILTEVAAQIGLVCLGIYLTAEEEQDGQMTFGLTSTEMEFMRPVMPGEKVSVAAEKVYFRFGKLKCRVTMSNHTGEEVCSGVIAGMIIRKSHE
ncbi:3-hydroxyacyl-ACP dehydratase FabZ family protein [Chitinophaga rhizophila]|uniref:Beta-hydroxyacyl-ACP dehydratase n=1 Tax=Chitinophaga rhizophila TaxID=2866212 RepID=A0ABS7G511_9BACT|nr:3-hydroxyacyl-ACP dehydratase FabZ family protein [Chitinophaga rhizophila]MBW8682751.1 beta-hydroxyacyl-ACP dehydratase [Chitinophaga rhizophila]